MSVVREGERQSCAWVSIGVLLFQNHLKLAKRVLESLAASFVEGHAHVRDCRLAHNAVHPETNDYVEAWSREMHDTHGVRVIRYLLLDNACKYPVMRQMFLADPESPASHVMWFDDDAYLTNPPGWWDRVKAAAFKYDMLGKLYTIPIRMARWRFVKSQSWYNPTITKPLERNGRPIFRFCQGSWWVIRSALLRRYDWPMPELRHCGGDQLLGELCRQQGLSIGEFEEGVRFNADSRGRHSASPRRGVNEPNLGDDYEPGRKYDTSHQDIAFARLASK